MWWGECLPLSFAPLQPAPALLRSHVFVCNLVKFVLSMRHVVDRNFDNEHFYKNRFGVHNLPRHIAPVRHTKIASSGLSIGPDGVRRDAPFGLYVSDLRHIKFEPLVSTTRAMSVTDVCRVD